MNIDEICKEIADRGLLIEAGWTLLKGKAVPEAASEHQIHLMRASFFLGAKYLFDMLLHILDEKEEEATAGDMAIMDKIHSELQTFVQDYLKKPAA